MLDTLQDAEHAARYPAKQFARSQSHKGHLYKQQCRHGKSNDEISRRNDYEIGQQEVVAQETKVVESPWCRSKLRCYAYRCKVISPTDDRIADSDESGKSLSDCQYANHGTITQLKRHAVDCKGINSER